MVGRRYADGTDRMQAALRTAAGIREASAAEAGIKDRELAEREAALRDALGLLDLAAGPGKTARPVSGSRHAVAQAGHSGGDLQQPVVLGDALAAGRGAARDAIGWAESDGLA